VAATGGDSAAAFTSVDLPAFVPARYRDPILRSAARWHVPPALMAGQLMAESGFDPDAGSPAGAQGIAQFMPSTAAAYGLADPFDPVASIDAEAHLMADLLRQFGSPELALAAYNAGPAPVEACHCIPPYPETQAYVTRILALIGGAGAIAMPSFEVRLVE
jgi:soluble lytic murein transglycosylase-like protein